MPGIEPDDTVDSTVTTRSSRDRDVLRDRLQQWLTTRLPQHARPEITSLRVPDTNGMSSESLLFDATWADDAGRVPHPLVARVAPDPDDVPVFPAYDLASQFRVMELVATHSPVPVPPTLWFEPDASALGAPFFVMGRVDGRVPPDVMPYNMEGWLRDAPAPYQRALQDATVRALADLHAIPLDGLDVSYLEAHAPGDTPLRRHVAHWLRYYDWVRDDLRYPLVEAGFAWLDDHWPEPEGPTVLSWGDARIGNIVYDGFAPAALLDWEMAGLAPRAVDVGWMIGLHLFFEHVADQLGLPGLPQFMRTEEVAATYEAHANVSAGDLRFGVVYALLRHGVIMARVHARRVHFGEAEWPDDPDDAIMHRTLLAQLLD